MRHYCLEVFSSRKAVLGMYNNHTKSRDRGFNRNTNSFGKNRNFGNRSRRFSSSSIDPNKFINKATNESTQTVEEIENEFADFRIDNRLKELAKANGFSEPTPIQDKVIPLLTEGRDVIGTAETGTGKTVAFLLPLIDKVLKNSSEKVLIVVPTRELALQIEEELRKFTRGMQIYSVVLIGGSNMGYQLRTLKQRPHFIIGTPGRLLDHINRRTLHLDCVNNLVLDEADLMVEMGFIKDVKEIISKMPLSRQSLFFSATITPDIQQLINNFTHNPVMVSVKRRETAQNVDQDIIRFNDTAHKMTLLHDLLISDACKKVLIFGRTKHGVEKLHNDLVERGFKSTSIHGNKNQSQRKRAIIDFKGNHTQILVATDVAARGLDIPDVTHVINFDIPEAYSDYVHRIGRTGRANKKGIALTFVGAHA